MNYAAAGFDSPAQTARRELALALVSSFSGLSLDAKRIGTEGHLGALTSIRLIAAGLTSAVAFELIHGIVLLTHNRNAYAASALVRQLVETEYLAWAVSRDPEEARDWLRSDVKGRLARWQPGKLRDRSGGRFPNEDYRNHCEAGGHPTPMGAQVILDNRDLWVEVVLYETALHGSNAWHYLVEAFEEIGLTKELAGQHKQLDQVIDEWRNADPWVGIGPEGMGPKMDYQKRSETGEGLPP